MNKRNLRLDKYGISPKRYKELCGFCEQYPDWKRYLQENHIPLKSPTLSDMPMSPNMEGDKTGDTAVRCADYQRNCDLIERVAKESSDDLWQFIIKSVCYEVSFTYLKAYDEVPLEKSAFYERRRYFFYLLDREKR